MLVEEYERDDDTDTGPPGWHQLWSQIQFVVLDPSCSFVAHDIPELQEMSQEEVGRHYEFECGFGIPPLKKYRAQSPQTPETPKKHQHGGIKVL
jgi:hypothetical protein